MEMARGTAGSPQASRVGRPGDHSTADVVVRSCTRCVYCAIRITRITVPHGTAPHFSFGRTHRVLSGRQCDAWHKLPVLFMSVAAWADPLLTTEHKMQKHVTNTRRAVSPSHIYNISRVVEPSTGWMSDDIHVQR